MAGKSKPDKKALSQVEGDWGKFEKAVDALIKSPPKPKPAKEKTTSRHPDPSKTKERSETDDD